MDVFLANFSFFNHILFILILTNNFFNFIKTMSWVFAIEVSVFDYENRVVEKVFGRLRKFVQFWNIKVFYALLLFIDFKII